MQFLYFSLFALAVAGADQITKFLTVAHIPLNGSLPFLPGVVRLTYVQNIGAAFSMLEGMRWLFVLVFLGLTAMVVYEFFKAKLPFTTFERWCIAAIYGGGLGNIIDRIRLGYVVDMIQTEFMVFPVFNVADCFITCGCILLVVHLAFFNSAFRKLRATTDKTVAVPLLPKDPKIAGQSRKE